MTDSRVEQEIRNELMRSNTALQDGTNEGLALALKNEGFEIKKAYVINWIPEQGEDIYEVLVSQDQIVSIEISRGGGEMIFEKFDIFEYQKKCSKIQKRKIAIAQKISLE